MNDAGEAALHEVAAGAGATVYTVLRAAHALEDRLEAVLATVGLSSPKFSVLSELASAQEPLALSELATRLSCVRSNMTQLVDRLEADGLVKRVDCPHDRRSVKAALTSVGAARQVAGAEAVARLNVALVQALPKADFDALQRVLSALG